MDNTNKVMEKIKKLLSLGENNPNENEAQSAILKAHELMAEHGIHSVSTEENITYTKEFCIHKGNRKFRRNLASIIAPNFRCKNYTSNGRIAFFGRSTDAGIAKEVFEYAYSFAYKESNRLYNEARKQGRASDGIVNSYAIGFIRGLKEKLDAQSTALMVITPPDVKKEFDDYGKQIGMRTSRCNLTTSKINNSAYNSGLSDGRTVMNGRRLETA